MVSKWHHLSYENDIGIFTKGSSQGIGIIVRINTDLPLVDHGHLMLMQILDGVFQSDDMGISVVVDLVNNSGKSNGVTTPVGPVTNTSPRLR